MSKQFISLFLLIALWGCSMQGKKVGAELSGSTNSTSTKDNTIGKVTIPYPDLSLEYSVLKVDRTSIKAGESVRVTLEARDASNKLMRVSKQSVTFLFDGGESEGVFGAITENANGSLQVNFTGTIAGVPTTLMAKINDQFLESVNPTVRVSPGPLAYDKSQVSISASTVSLQSSQTITFTARDKFGNIIDAEDNAPTFSVSGGTSNGIISSVTNLNNGNYTATFLATAAGTASTIHALVRGVAITSAAPSITVVAGLADTSGGVGLTSTVKIIASGLVADWDAAQKKTPETTCASPAYYSWGEKISGNLRGYSSATCATQPAWSGSAAAQDPYRLNLDGISNYVALGDTLKASQFSIAIWFKRTGEGRTSNTGGTSPAYEPLFTKGRGENDGLNTDTNWALGIIKDPANPSRFRFFTDFENIVNGANFPQSSSKFYDNDRWYNVVVTYDQKNRKIYVDGALDSSQSLAITPRNDSIQHAAIGSSLDSKAKEQGFFKGAVSYAAFYNRALIPEEVKSNCESLAARLNIVCSTAPGALSPQLSQVKISSTTVVPNSKVNVFLIPKDAKNTVISSGNRLVHFCLDTDGTSRGTLSETKVDDKGIYSAVFTATQEGTPTSIRAKVGGTCTNSVGEWVVSTNPKIEVVKKVRFAIIGDFGTTTEETRRVVALIKSKQPDFIVTSGDNNYGVGQGVDFYDRHVGQYFHEFIANYNGTQGGPVTATNQFFPAIGNHDIDLNNGMSYADFFTLPGNERYYDIVWSNMHFFFVNSDVRERDGNYSYKLVAGKQVISKQASWLKQKLASSKAPFKIVVFHHPPYLSGHHKGYSMQWPFKEWGATAVVNGHFHGYERIRKNNLTYFVVGHGGASTHAFECVNPGQRYYEPGSRIKDNAAHGAMIVETSATEMNFKYYQITKDANGEYRLVDDYVLSPSGNSPKEPAVVNKSYPICVCSCKPEQDPDPKRCTPLTSEQKAKCPK